MPISKTKREKENTPVPLHMGVGAEFPGHDLCQGTPLALGPDPPPMTSWGHHLCPHIRDEPDDATDQEEEADVDEAPTIEPM